MGGQQDKGRYPSCFRVAWRSGSLVNMERKSTDASERSRISLEIGAAQEDLQHEVVPALLSKQLVSVRLQ